MENLYKELGFEAPKVLVNPYGIKIYTGTKGDDDWCVEIPARLVKATGYNYNKEFVFYMITEDEALRIASKFTNLAKKYYEVRQ